MKLYLPVGNVRTMKDVPAAWRHAGRVIYAKSKTMTANTVSPLIRFMMTVRGMCFRSPWCMSMVMDAANSMMNLQLAGIAAGPKGVNAAIYLASNGRCACHLVIAVKIN